MDHQALAQMLGNYGEFVGAIAVVATLAYLASKGFLNDAAMAPSAPAATSDNKKTAAGADNTSEQTPRQAG